jgi:UDP-3-O-[3-hydroxymyristoyl] glucosamine N-acyltransferase
VKSYKLSYLAKHIHGQLIGDSDHEIEDVSAIETANERHLSFFYHKRYRPILKSTSAGALILDRKSANLYSGNQIIVDDPRLAFARISQLFHPSPSFKPGIHPTAIIDGSSEIPDTAHIGPYCVIGRNVSIGEHVYVGAYCYIDDFVSIGNSSQIFPRVTIHSDSVLGENCKIQSGVVIGCDGFGFVWDGSKWVYMPQIGRAILGDNIVIGANSTIDRGALKDTIVEDGVITDNQVLIAHNCVIGEHSALAGFVGIAGSSVIGKRVRLGGRCTILGHIQICDDTFISSNSLVTSSIKKPGMYSSAIRVDEAGNWRKNSARINQLDRIVRKINKIERMLNNKVKEQ